MTQNCQSRELSHKIRSNGLLYDFFNYVKSFTIFHCYWFNYALCFNEDHTSVYREMLKLVTFVCPS